MSTMRTIFLNGLAILALTTSSTAFASKCGQQILKNNGLDPLSQSQIDCFAQNADFANVTAELCNKKRLAPSEMYQKYLESEVEFNAALAEMNALPQGSPLRSALAFKIRNIERDWQVFGYKDEVQMIQWTYLQPAAKACLSN